MEQERKLNLDLPSDMRELLAEVSVDFDSNLKRAFRNEAVRLQRINRPDLHIYSLSDVLVTVQDTKIELRQLKFPWIPDFRIDDMSAELPMSCIRMSLNLGHLQIEGRYEANNTVLRKLLPVPQLGRILILFNNVKARGRAGLVVKGDSLVPLNYDLVYEPSDVLIRVAYFDEDGKEIENEVVDNEIGNTLGKTIWNELTDCLTNLLHQQLAEVVVEFSLTELLVDRDDEYRGYAREQANRANKLVDSLLCTAKDGIVTRNLRRVSTGGYDVVFKGKASGMRQGSLVTGDGFLEDLTTLTRMDSFSLYEDKQHLIVYGSLSLREFKHGYEKYEAEYEDTHISGSIKMSVYKNKIFVVLNVRKEGERCTIHLDHFRFTKIDEVDVDISGLASLSWLMDRIRSWTLGNVRQYTLTQIEGILREAFEDAIERSDCVALLAD